MRIMALLFLMLPLVAETGDMARWKKLAAAVTITRGSAERGGRRLATRLSAEGLLRPH